jgi:hypothetical protein
MADESGDAPVSVTAGAVTTPPTVEFELGEIVQPPTAEVDLDTLVKPPTPTFNAAKEKATGAREVARVLVFTFAATIAATFLTIALIYVLSASPAQAKDFVAAFTGIVPVMENFVTKIFGPLLAFVLGYYFGEKGKTTPSTS